MGIIYASERWKALQRERGGLGGRREGRGPMTHEQAESVARRSAEALPPGGVSVTTTDDGLLVVHRCRVGRAWARHCVGHGERYNVAALRLLANHAESCTPTMDAIEIRV